MNIYCIRLHFLRIVNFLIESLQAFNRYTNRRNQEYIKHYRYIDNVVFRRNVSV